MKAKIYLQQVGLLEERILLRKNELDALRLQVKSIQGIDNENKVQKTVFGSRTERETIKCMEMEEEILQMMSELRDCRHEIIGQIQMIENAHFIKILNLKYIEGMTLEKIAKEMHFSYDHIKRMHGWALQAFQQIIDSETP